MNNPEPRDAATLLERVPPEYVAGWSFPWANLMRLWGHSGELGEVRRSSDWSRLPTDQGPIRIVAIREKGVAVIRWATDDWLTRFAGKDAGHHQLLGSGDDVSDVRSGYATPLSDGSFLVK